MLQCQFECTVIKCVGLAFSEPDIKVVVAWKFGRLVAATSPGLLSDSVVAWPYEKFAFNVTFDPDLEEKHLMLDVHQIFKGGRRRDVLGSTTVLLNNFINVEHSLSDFVLASGDEVRKDRVPLLTVSITCTVEKVARAEHNQTKITPPVLPSLPIPNYPVLSDTDSMDSARSHLSNITSSVAPSPPSRRKWETAAIHHMTTPSQILDEIRNVHDSVSKQLKYEASEWKKKQKFQKQLMENVSTNKKKLKKSVKKLRKDMGLKSDKRPKKKADEDKQTLEKWRELRALEEALGRCKSHLDSLRAEYYFPRKCGYRISVGAADTFLGAGDFWVHTVDANLVAKVVADEVPYIHIQLKGNGQREGFISSITFEKLGITGPNLPRFAPDEMTADVEMIIELDAEFDEGKWKVRKKSLKSKLIRLDKTIKGSITAPDQIVRLITNAVVPVVVRQIVKRSLTFELGSFLQAQREDVIVEGHSIVHGVAQKVLSTTFEKVGEDDRALQMLGLDQPQGVALAIVSEKGFQRGDARKLNSLSALSRYYLKYSTGDPTRWSYLCGLWDKLFHILPGCHPVVPTKLCGTVKSLSFTDLMKTVATVSQKPCAVTFNATKLAGSVNVDALVTMIRAFLTRIHPSAPALQQKTSPVKHVPSNDKDKGKDPIAAPSTKEAMSDVLDALNKFVRDNLHQFNAQLMVDLVEQKRMSTVEVSDATLTGPIDVDANMLAQTVVWLVRTFGPRTRIVCSGQSVPDKYRVSYTSTLGVRDEEPALDAFIEDLATSIVLDVEKAIEQYQGKGVKYIPTLVLKPDPAVLKSGGDLSKIGANLRVMGGPLTRHCMAAKSVRIRANLPKLFAMGTPVLIKNLSEILPESIEGKQRALQLAETILDTLRRSVATDTLSIKLKLILNAIVKDDNVFLNFKSNAGEHQHPLQFHSTIPLMVLYDDLEEIVARMTTL